MAATLTTNLFRGRGPGDERLEVVQGHWPTDMSGHVFVVGPDKREPGGHWFAEHGLLTRVDLRPAVDDRIVVTTRRVQTAVARLRDRWPGLFRRVAFAEVSPFGVTNLANTNVAPLDGRLFIGYDAGRPVEVDPVTLEVCTPVGANREWLQSVPGLCEPLVSVAAHPAQAWDEHALYFVNYAPFPGNQQVSVARWGLNGPVERWPLRGMPQVDSIHDIKATDHHLVFTDLPFVVEPETFRGHPRTIVNQDITRVCIVAKADLRATPPGHPVPVRVVEIPMPTGHLSVDATEVDGVLTVYLEQIPLADLMLSLGPDGPHPDYEGLITLGVQPGAVGRYRICAATGEVLDAEVATDDRFWGGVLATRDESTPQARRIQRHLWYAGSGYDPALISDEWRRLYQDAGLTCLVDPHELPEDPIAASIARFDLEAMKVAEVYEFPSGQFCSPPTFVPRDHQAGPGDGYVVAMVHRDGDKELAVFDAQDLERGPLARATAAGYCPPLLLHSCWMPSRTGPRPSRYRVPLRRDVAGALGGVPGVLRTWAGVARSMRAAAN